MNQLHEALRNHTPTPEATSKATIKKHFEFAWNNARLRTIEGHGLTVDIILAAVTGMESRTRSKIITADQYNYLMNIATAAQANLSLIYSADARCQVLHARLSEAHRNSSSGLGWRAF